ncbi:hypothetical protein LSUCC0246_06600 [Rhodobacterales bacterium LSUCC0246]|nr:hypothetical protein [Rhodobacterales bacterium LSUCC0374]
MTLKLRANELYTSDGKWLKTIHCPKKLKPDGLRSSKHGQLTCAECNHTVFDTDYMSEKQLVELLTNNPDSCLKINLANPIFERIDCLSEKQGEDDGKNW